MPKQSNKTRSSRHELMGKAILDGALENIETCQMTCDIFADEELANIEVSTCTGTARSYRKFLVRAKRFFVI